METIWIRRCVRSLAAVVLGAGLGGCTDDVPLNDLAHDRNEATRASRPAVAYGAGPDEFLVAFVADPVANGDDDGQVWARRVSASTGDVLGAAFQVSDLLPGTATALAMAHSEEAHRYLTVFKGEVVGLEPRLHVHAVDEIGNTGEDLRVSNSEPQRFAVAYNSIEQEFLVVWNSAGAGSSGTIRGQRIDAATGTEVGVDDFLILDGVTAMAGVDVVHNPDTDEYLLAAIVGTASGYDAVGQRLVGATGKTIGGLLPIGRDVYENDLEVQLTYARARGYIFAIWPHQHRAAMHLQLHGQLLDGPTGAEVGEDDFLVSSSADDTSEPRVAYDPTRDQVIVTAHGTYPTASGHARENLFMREDLTTLAPVCAQDVVFSDQDPLGTALYDPAPGLGSAIAASSVSGRFLAVWGNQTLLTTAPPPPGGEYVYELDVEGDLSSPTSLCADL